MRTWTLLPFALVFSGCCHDKPLVIPQRPIACALLDAPPSLSPIEFDPAGCPSTLICMPPKDANRLATYMERSQTWMQEAYTRCGPPPLPKFQQPSVLEASR